MQTGAGRLDTTFRSDRCLLHYPGGPYSTPTRQSGYNLYWTTEYNGVEYSFTGRYINETVVIGMEVGLVKSTSCRFLHEFIITVTAKRTFCH